MMEKQIIRPSRALDGATRCSVRDGLIRAVYPAMVFFYDQVLDTEQLASSLALILNDFPTFAGAFVTGPEGLEIKHAGNGVQFEVVHSDQPLEFFQDAAKQDRKAVIAPRLSGSRILKGVEVLLAVRVTLATNGSALCVMWSHSVGDMETLMLLLRAWACTYSGQPYEKPTLLEDVDAYLAQALPDPEGIAPPLRLASWTELAGYALELMKPCSRFNIELTWNELHAIHAAAGAPNKVSVNDALCAHVFLYLRRLARTTEPANLCLTVNYRKRLGIPEGTLGNFVCMVEQPVGPEAEPGEVAAGLREHIDHLSAKYLDYHACRRVIESYPKKGERMRLVSKQFRPGRGDLAVVNWNNFDVYKLCFGDAQPVLFSCISELPRWSIIIHELPKNSGLCLRVALSPNVAELVTSADLRAALIPEQGAPPAGEAHAPLSAGNVA